jgi:C-terminal processing protease CtpA/Prc
LKDILMKRSLILLALLSLLSGAALAQTDGVVAITGTLTYTSTLFTTGVAQPIIILEDQAGFVDRNLGFLMPPESQTLGQLTSDFFTSPVTYSLALPIEPQGTFRDVDNNGRDDLGVQIYAVAYWNNVFGDPYLEERDLYGGGWSTAYASTRVSEASATLYEIVGGKFVIYAPDDNQAFPSGFGADRLLFTEDDPTVPVPRGWTVVDLDTNPFTFIRDPRVHIDLIEPDGAALDDFSALSYTQAFDAMVTLMKREYAFTEYKGIDWLALSAEFRPRFQDAEQRRSANDYQRALRDFLWQIPDGHIALYPFEGAIYDDFVDAAIGGIGIAIRELDDGRALVTFVTPNSPAANAGITIGTEILTINGFPTDIWISAITPPTSPFSTEHVRRLEQTVYAVRFPVGAQVDVTFRTDGVERSATMTAFVDLDSYFAANDESSPTGYELPVEFEVLPSGYVLARIWSFSDNDLLTVQLWERLMIALRDNNAPGVIIDMRNNGGGSGFLADQMAAYFFNQPLILGGTAFFDDSIGRFFQDTNRLERFYLPPDELRYNGRVAVIVGPSCVSACEFFAYNMTLQDRAAIVGHYPTGGLGGSITDFAMPDGIFVRFTIGRAVDADGNIHIEGIGVPPTVRVPLDEAALFGDSDVLIDAAVAALSRR